MKTLLVHPGTQYAFQLARQLELHGCLGRFWTGLAYVPDSAVGRCVRLLPATCRHALANRRLEGVRVQSVRTKPCLEMRAIHRLRAGEDDQKVMFERNRAFQVRIPRREFTTCDAVVGFDTSSWILAERASAMPRPFLLDQSIGHPLSYQAMSRTLRRRHPEWIDDFPERLRVLLDAEVKEHRFASKIVAASSFTRRTLIENGISAEKIVVNPYGVDLNAFSPVSRPDSSRPLRFLFLGSVSARKGVPLLLDTWRDLAPKNAELWLVGPLPARNARLIPALPGLRVLGKRPHRDLPDLLHQCDVLVLPSYFEGFGLVLLEALAAGLPIIATDSTAAPDLITQGVEGYVIPAGDREALQTTLEAFVSSRAELTHMSQAARRCAERYSWDAYGARWAKLLQQVA
jgi:alpha-maltose-1-phosphate synthase